MEEAEWENCYWWLFRRFPPRLQNVFHKVVRGLCFDIDRSHEKGSSRHGESMNVNMSNL